MLNSENAGFIQKTDDSNPLAECKQDASNPLAECKQDASPETETEAETETEGEAELTPTGNDLKTQHGS